jgi:hypothetical protein
VKRCRGKGVAALNVACRGGIGVAGLATEGRRLGDGLWMDLTDSASGGREKSKVSLPFTRRTPITERAHPRCQPAITAFGRLRERARLRSQGLGHSPLHSLRVQRANPAVEAPSDACSCLALSAHSVRLLPPSAWPWTCLKTSNPQPISAAVRGTCWWFRVSHATVRPLS